MKRTLALPITVLALVAAACTSTGSSAPDSEASGVTEPGATDPAATPDGTDPDVGSGPAGPVGFAPAALQQFGDCAAFIDHIHTEGAERVGPYGFDGGGYGVPMFSVDAEMAMDDSTDAGGRAEAPAATSATSGEDAAAVAPDVGGDDGTFSTTNVQVDGVDEPDIVKTDGNRIVAIAGEMLHYIDIAEDGTTGTLRGSVKLNGDDETGQYSYGHEIFLSGDRIFVFAQGESGYFPGGPVFVDEPVAVEPDIAPVEEPDAPVTTDAIATTVRSDDDVPSETIDTPEDQVDAEAGFAPPDSGESDLVESLPPPRPIGPGAYAGPQTLVIEIDASNPDALTVAHTMRIDGRYISARSVGDTARLVVTSPPQDLGFLYPSNPGTEDRAEEANRQVVLDSTAEDWIPDYTLVDAAGNEQTGQIADCSSVNAPSDFSGFDMLSILTLDLGGSLTPPSSAASVLASGDTVYASQDRLYVSTNIWEPIIDDQTQEWLDENYQTALHRFSIAGDGPATYEGSGSVEGHLLNQFSMNDRDGVLYAATTTGAPWGGGEDSVSQIVALELNDRTLEQVGSVGGLGETERIFSVRYVGDTAYVVTFRQTDPFYIVDLSDPRNMAVRGELKIPGYSSYLHPISDDFVLGVGQDATDEGRTTGTKVSLFDVSDPANPLEVDVWSLPNAYSDAEFDHRAFLWWAPTNTAVLPLQSYEDRFSGAVVLTVDNGVITEQGRITQADAEEGPVGQTDCRVLTREDLGGDENGELEWIFDGGNQVNLCTANQQGGATGMVCDTVPPGDLQYYYSGEPVIDVSQFDRVEFCYQDWNGYRIGVQRTMVIDGSLWTLSPERLQSNDLASLERTAAIDLT